MNCDRRQTTQQKNRGPALQERQTEIVLEAVDGSEANTPSRNDSSNWSSPSIQNSNQQDNVLPSPHDAETTDFGANPSQQSKMINTSSPAQPSDLPKPPVTILRVKTKKSQIRNAQTLELAHISKKKEEKK